MPEFWNDEQKLCTDNNKVYHSVTWPGITSANMIYKTQQNFEKAMQHSSDCQFTGNLKTIGLRVSLPSPISPSKTVQGSLHSDLQQSGTFRRSHQPTLEVQVFSDENGWRKGQFMGTPHAFEFWYRMMCINMYNHIHNGFLWDGSLKIIDDLICRLKTQLSAWTTRTSPKCHPSPRSRVGFFWRRVAILLPSRRSTKSAWCRPQGLFFQKGCLEISQLSWNRMIQSCFASPLETLYPYCNRILEKKAVDTAKWAIALIGAENQTAQSKGPWCYCPGVVEQSSW